MFEVIYISPSCRQAQDFIYDLAEKLKQNGISNFEVDMKRLQIKLDKFIISTSSIGMSPRPSFYGVKYYIDAVSNSHKPYNLSTGRLYDWLEYLKRRFRPDAKEISDEELIEILTEELA